MSVHFKVKFLSDTKIFFIVLEIVIFYFLFVFVHNFLQKNNFFEHFQSDWTHVSLVAQSNLVIKHLTDEVQCPSLPLYCRCLVSPRYWV